MKRKIVVAALSIACLFGVLQASTQNIATISDLKETIQILLKYKKAAEDRLLVIEKKLGITNAYQKAGEGDDIPLDAKALESANGGDIDKIKSDITNLQAAVKKLDPNAALDGGDDLKARTYVTQKEFEEFKDMVLKDLASIKETHEKINTILANGGSIAGGSVSAAEIWERLKKLERQMKDCRCALPESEIK